MQVAEVSSLPAASTVATTGLGNGSASNASAPNASSAFGLSFESPVSLVLKEVDLQRPNKPHMEGPKTAHEEAAMMRKLYQEMVLKKKLGADVEKNKPVQIKGLSRNKEETANA